MKRVTFLWLWVCALLWGAGVQVWGAPVTFVVDGYKYIVRSGESQRVTLSAIPRGVKDIVIPSSVQHEGVDYSVVWIGGDAIIASSIHSLSIPATVEGFSDEKYAFDDCDQLEKVTVDPSSEFFFSQDGCLYSKTLPKRCLVIPRMVKGTVVVPDDVVGGEYPSLYLEDKPNIEGIVFPAGLVNLTVKDCPSLVSATFPASAEGISIDGCPSLAKLEMSGKSERYEVEDNVLYGWYTEWNTDVRLRAIVFIGVDKTSYTMPADARLTSSYQAAQFAAMENLVSLSVAAGNAEYVSEDNAIYSREPFNGERSLVDLAGGLTSFHIPADVADVAHVEIPSDDYNFEDRVVPVFGMLKKLEKLTVTEGNKHFAASGNVLLQKADEAIGGGEEGWVAMLVAPALTGKVVLPDDVVKVDGMAFYGSLISSVTIPDGVMVSYGAFGNSKQLTEVIFKGSASAESSAFVGTPWLENHKPGVIYAGTTAIGLAGDLAEITIKPGTKTIGKEAFTPFDRPTSLVKVVLPDGLETIESYAFANCDKLKEINLPASLKTVVGNAFDYCTALSGLTLEEGITFLPDVFVDLPVKKVYVPASVGDWEASGFGYYVEAFEVSPDNPYYKSVDGIVYAKDLATVYMVPPAKTRVRIEEGVKYIGEPDEWARMRSADITVPEIYFGDRIESISLPSTLEAVYGYGMFSYCRLKECQVYNPSPIVLEENTFPYDLSGVTLYVPEGSLEAYKNAVEWSRFGHIEEFDASAINGLPAAQEVKEVGRYTLDGRKITQPERGINLIKMSDGTTRKVVVD